MAGPLALGRRSARCVILSAMVGAAKDARQSDWLTGSAGEFGGVHAIVPDVFEAYARIFHPAALGGREVRWADVASANGRTMHPAAEWGQLTGSWQLDAQAGLWDSAPEHGQTPGRLAVHLAAILAEHTSTAERCFFGVWEGWGGPGTPLIAFREGTTADERARALEKLEERRERIEAWDSVVCGAPGFEMPSRRMHLLSGSLPEIERFYGFDANAPSIWWPEDRAWCVGGGVDLMTTYLGASREAVEAVATDAELEALEIPAGQSVTWEADRVNPAVGPPPF